MRPGQIERRTPDDARHGATTLFTALNTKSGELIGQTSRHHRSQEFRNFLDTIERNVPEQMDVHLILDNYGTHKSQLIRDWLVKRPRFHLHFTPTSASWLNLVERWFALLTPKNSGAASIAPHANWKTPHTNTSTTTTATPNPSSGIRPLNRSSIPSHAFVQELQGHDISDLGHDSWTASRFVHDLLP
jgi:transposase